MKKHLIILLSLMFVALTSCSNDEPKIDNATGKLIVTIKCAESEINCDNFSVSITPAQGFGWSTPNYSEVEWPIDVKVGTYTIGVASPLVSETETTETYYFGERQDVEIIKSRITDLTINVKLTEFPK